MTSSIASVESTFTPELDSAGSRSLLPDDFEALSFDARRSLPLRASISVAAGTATVMVIAVPSDTASVTATPLDQTWFDGRSGLSPASPDAVAAHRELTAVDRDQIEVLRPYLAVTLAGRLCWSHPMLTGRALSVIDHPDRGLLFELYVADGWFPVASLRHAADLGARLTMGYRERQRGTSYHRSEAEEVDPYDLV